MNIKRADVAKEPAREPRHEDLFGGAADPIASVRRRARGSIPAPHSLSINGERISFYSSNAR